MNKMRIGAAAILTAILQGQAFAQSNSGTDRERVGTARALFDRYIALERAFEPAVADLYAPDALIRNRRKYPTGQVRELTIPATQYQELVRQAMPLAKAQNDTNRYSDCSYASEGKRVRIKCSRYSERKNYSSPIELLVGPSNTGAWLVFEELSESQP
jgi:hypothetical protein